MSIDVVPPMLVSIKNDIYATCCDSLHAFLISSCFFKACLVVLSVMINWLLTAGMRTSLYSLIIFSRYHEGRGDLQWIMRIKRMFISVVGKTASNVLISLKFTASLCYAPDICVSLRVVDRWELSSDLRIQLVGCQQHTALLCFSSHPRVNVWSSTVQVNFWFDDLCIFNFQNSHKHQWGWSKHRINQESTVLSSRQLVFHVYRTDRWIIPVLPLTSRTIYSSSIGTSYTMRLLF